MSKEYSKTVNGHQAPNRAIKLATLDQLPSYEIVFINHKKTKFHTYIVTIKDIDKGEDFNYWMSEYVIKDSTPEKCFLYNGLKPQGEGSGHSYHSVLWTDSK